MVVEVGRMQESAGRQQDHLSSWQSSSTPDFTAAVGLHKPGCHQSVTDRGRTLEAQLLPPEQQIDSGRERPHCLLLHDTGEPTRAQWIVPNPVTQMDLDKLSGPENDTKDMNSGREFGGEWFTEGVGDRKTCLLGDNNNECMKLSKHSWLLNKISKNI